MKEISTIFCLFPVLANCVIYMDRVTSDFNPKLVDLKISYNHNSKGEAVTNVSFVTRVEMIKLLVYLKFSVAENKDDHECRREMLSTVIDGGKLFKGSQSNYLIRLFFDSIAKGTDFEWKLPLPPGTYRFTNIVIDSKYFPFVQDFLGKVDMRMVIKSPENAKLQFFAQCVFYGGFRKA